MSEIRRKDALTNLVDVGSSSSESQESSNSAASIPSSEKVELGFSDRIRHLAEKLVKSIQLRKKQESETKQYLNRKF